MGKFQTAYEKLITNESALNKLAYNIIKNRIIFDQLHPGQRLSAAKLADQLKISRTPVAAALSSLERDGYVVVYPQRGTFVRELTPFELEIIFRSRASLGKLVIQSAGHTIDRNDLENFYNEFKRFRSMKYINNPDLMELFYIDVEFHRLLDECIPGIIHDQTKVIADLTMNSRYIAYRNRFGGSSDQKIKELCCDNHILIIEHLLKNDVERAAEAFVKDVHSGWEGTKL